MDSENYGLQLEENSLLPGSKTNPGPREFSLVLLRAMFIFRAFCYSWFGSIVG